MMLAMAMAMATATAMLAQADPLHAPLHAGSESVDAGADSTIAVFRPVLAQPPA
jgi:hypothetical protein